MNYLRRLWLRLNEPVNISQVIASHQKVPCVVEIPVDLGLLLVLLFFSAVMTLAAIWLFMLPWILPLENIVRDRIAIFSFGGFCSIIFGVATWACARRIACRRFPVYRFTTEGVVINLRGQGYEVPWRIVGDVVKGSFRYTYYIELRLRPEWYVSLSKNEDIKLIFARFGYASSILVSPAIAKISHRELLALFRYYAQKYAPYFKGN